MFSRKHDLFCCKKGKAWLTGYSWHSRKAGRAKVGAEANLHLYVPRAGRGAALHLAGHPPAVPVPSLRTAISRSFSKARSLPRARRLPPFPCARAPR